MAERTATRMPDFNTLAVLAAVGLGAYVIYKATQLPAAIGTAAQAAGAAVSKTLLPFPTGTASIVLDDGSEIAWSAANWHTAANLDWWRWSGNSRFDYQGATYELTNDKPDETNTYYALRVQ